MDPVALLAILRKIQLRSWVLAVAIIEPLTTLPQIYQIWIKHEAAGVSIWTWGLYVIAAFIWLAYGLKLKDTPLITTSILWVVMELVVVIGVMIN